MKYILFSILLAGGMAAPSYAETLSCTFDVKDRYREWVPSQITLIRDRDYGRDKISADLFRQAGRQFVPADLALKNDKRVRFTFRHNNPGVTFDGYPPKGSLGKTLYSLTIYSDGRPALLKVETPPVIVAWKSLIVRFKGECSEK